LVKAIVALEDGTILRCKSFGYPCEVSGEVVFNAGVTGYTESLTDPSYFGQILIQAYPLIGNYGVPPYSVIDEFGIPFITNIELANALADAICQTNSISLDPKSASSD